jgi:lipoprotein-anchoring transpeptidase ErfK/SrfK
MAHQHQHRSVGRSVRTAAVVAVAGLLSVLVAAPSGATATAPGPVVAPGPRPAPPPPALPKRAFAVTVTPANGAVVGIAYPITAKFSIPVAAARRADAERHMHVYVNGIFSKGAWYWRDSRTAVFRTQNFWPGRSRIQVRMTLAGVEVNRSAQYAFVGGTTTTRTHTVRTSRVLVARVSAITHRMVVYIDGRVVKNFGTSLGKAGFETRSGFKAVMEKYITRNMTSQELGLTNETYDLWAPYSTRITPTGEFVHGAPWAAGRIGRWNGSHGCTNLLTNDAKWFYYATIPGDLVITTGTGRSMEYWNGTGAPYNMPWSLWLAHSALKGKP